jgi:hypothetical protein
VPINRLLSPRFDDAFDAAATRRRPGPSVALRPYGSLLELRRALDAAVGARLHAVIALAPDFNGHLPSLIRNHGSSASLTLTATDGAFPPVPCWSFTGAGRSLGWRTICLEPDWAAAIRGAATTAPVDAWIEIYWPAWLTLDEAAFDAACAEVRGTWPAQHRLSGDVTLGSYHESA